MSANIGLLDESCVGREREREEIGRFFEQAELRPGAAVCAITGLGGIGKTTLARALASDFSRRHENGVTLLLDCVALPKQADMATVLRALDPEVDASSPIRRAAAKLDQIAASIGSAEPDGAIDTDASARAATESSSQPSARAWSDTRRAALEVLSFFSSETFEHVTFAQGGTSANAIVAGVQAFASARSALAQVVATLQSQERMSAEDAAIALDPEPYTVQALAEFFSGLGDERPLALLIDKAENLSDRLFRLIMLFDEAARRAGRRLTLIVAGLLKRLTLPDGSELEVAEFLKATALPAKALELTPFTPEQVGELLTATHERMHGCAPSVPPPAWLRQAVAAISEGLPLWAAILAEGLFAHQAEPWVDGDVSLLQRLREGVDFPKAAAQVFREVTLDSDASAFPLLVALAIAPTSTPTSVVCEAANVPAGAVLELAGRYSFMRGERLHDGARAVLRRYLIGWYETNPELVSVAEALQRWLVDRAPAESVHSGDRDWTELVPDAVELAFWIDRRGGVEALVNYLLAAFPTAPSWTGPLVERASWFVQNKQVPEAHRNLIEACVRVLHPVILADILARGVEERNDSAVRRTILEQVHARPEFAPSTGRHLDIVTQRLAQADVKLSDDARVGLDSLRINWLIQNGFEADAFALAADVTRRLVSIRRGAPVRRYLGRALSAVIRQYAHSAALAAVGEQSDRRDAIDKLVEMIVMVDAPSAIQGIRDVTFRLGTSTTVSTALEQLYSERHDVLDPGAVWSNLGFAALEQGKFETADTIFHEALARYPDWLAGTRGRGLALLGMGRVEEAAMLLLSTVRRAATLSGLSPARKVERDRLIEAGLVALVATEQTHELAAISRLDGLEMNDYSTMLIELFAGSASSALSTTERFVAASGDPRWQAPEIAIALARCGRYEEARGRVREWRALYKPAYMVLLDELLLKAAIREGWFGSLALPEILAEGEPRS